jgi:spore coat polysaccharide biosynthesis predicted glycosyltransferase SpsG/ribosomal protein S18 acetylase RimI-like enzyme
MDHYDLDPGWLHEAREFADRRVVIDDLANRPLPCDLLINAGLGARSNQYTGLVSPPTTLLLGPRYALLRSAVAAAHDATRDRPHGELRSVLITFGGTDPWRLIGSAIQAVRLALPETRIDLVVANSDAVPNAIRDAAVRVHVGVGDEAMTRLMTDADLAIGAGGMTAFERCAVGLPSIAIRLAANQDEVVTELAAAGAAVDGGGADGLQAEGLAAEVRRLAHDAALRSDLGTRGWHLIDGRGAIRVAHHLEGVKVRRATLADARRLWLWRNDPQVRAASIQSGRISFEGHVRWLEDALRDPARLLLIGWNGAGELGQIRFDRHGSEADVSISVAPEHRGTVGGLLLRAGIRHIRRKWPTPMIRARVKVENQSSQRLFERAGFDLEGRSDGLLSYRLARPTSPHLDES